ncbi:MAG: rod shape-determining protein MreC [Tissierellia bacterium]|nr:rod shape-determining protein MreC [Tissierellia bacterium]
MLYHRKKKSNKKFYIIALILLVLIFISSINDNFSKAGSNLANTLLKPVNKVTYSISASVKRGFEDVFGSKKTREDVKKLEAENKKLKEDNAIMKSTINKEEFLKSEYEAVNNSDKDYIKAYVINKDQNPFSDKFNIDKGKKDGVEVGDIILQAMNNDDYYEGIIGKVINVNENSATVETLISSANNISFINSNSGDYGVIDSYYDGSLEGYMLELEGEVEKGDILLTGGIGGVYPKNYYLGKVTSVDISQDGLKKSVSITTDVDFAHLYRVLVLKNKGDQNE